jgi:hypothetical protein
MKTRKLASALALAVTLSVHSIYAGSATWSLSPGSGDWNTAGNWTPATVPNAATDTATFDLSNTVGVSISANTEVDGLVFNSGANPFTITASPTWTLTISGAGVANNSGNPQNFVTAVDASFNSGVILFKNSATAGSATFFTNNAGVVTGGPGGSTEFFNTATADNGTFVNNGGAVSGAGGGTTQFFNGATAGNATITNNAGTGGGITQFFNTAVAGTATITSNGGAVSGQAGGITFFFGNSSADNGVFTSNGGSISGASGGSTQFLASSTAGGGTFTNNGGTVSGAGGSSTQFKNNSNAGSAILTANGGVGTGGSIVFLNDATGGTAQVEVNGNGFLEISQHNAPGVTVGSLKGSGNVFLGSRNLTVGSNNISTTFSGVIQDGGAGGGTGGSLTKSGSGTLTLSGTNTYTGATSVTAGKLLVDGSITSAVTVNGGTLGGSGSTGAVTVNSGATLSPGDSVDILHVYGNLGLSLGSTYLVDLNGVAVGTQYDQTDVAGLVSLGDATLTLSLGFTPPVNSSFIIINNDLTDSVSGMFAGLAEGATFAAGGQTFMISYAGGDGNDVVLTDLGAVPEPATWLSAVLTSGVLLSCLRQRKKLFRS